MSTTEWTPPKGWRWVAGMLSIEGVRVVDDPSVVPGSVFVVKRGGSTGRYTWHPHAVETRHLTPDLTDPATLGCLLALVREAWGDGRLSTVHCAGMDMRGPWAVWFSGAIPQKARLLNKRFGTEAEALLAALEAAP